MTHALTRNPKRLLARPLVAAAMVLLAATLARAQDPASSAASASSPPPGASWQSVRAGSLAWYAVLALSVVSVALMVDLALLVRPGRLVPRALADELESRLRARRIDDAIRLCQEPASDSLVARVVLAALRLRYQGSAPTRAELELAAQEAGQTEAARLYRRTDMLAAVGTLAPLLGLLGTAQHLVSAFHAIAASGASATAADLAGAASHALVTTVWGLVVAIVALTALAVFRARLDSLLNQAATRVEQILQPLG